jgi:ferredoxin
MPKPRVLEKYDVDESRCILCGICVDACPYDALRCGPDFELSHESRSEPLIDLLAISAIDRDTEMSWIRKERDWLERAQAQGRSLDAGRFLPMLPASIPGNGNGHASGNGHAAGNGHSHDDHGLAGMVDIRDETPGNPPAPAA